MTAPGVLLGLACAAGGVGLLRAAWSRRGGALPIVAGWLLSAAGVVGWRLAGAAWDKAVALAILATSLAALGVLAAKAELPPSGAKAARRRPTVEVEPPAAGGSAWRSWARIACMGPLALAAAVGCGAWTALRPPWEEADRLVASGFVMPVVWAAGAVWATTDDRPGRVAATLALLAAVTLGTARP